VAILGSAQARTVAVPAVLVVSAAEVGARSGALLREVGAGVVIRVDDMRIRRTVGWLSADPPTSVAAVLDGLPAPGEAADRLPLDEAG
jgi:hypothetical protein